MLSEGAWTLEAFKVFDPLMLVVVHLEPILLRVGLGTQVALVRFESAVIRGMRVQMSLCDKSLATVWNLAQVWPKIYLHISKGSDSYMRAHMSFDISSMLERFLALYERALKFK